MIGRYRDGVVPADPGGDDELAGEVATAVEATVAELRPARPLPRHRGRLAARPAPEPAGRAAGPLDAGQGPRPRRRARPDALQPGRGPPGGGDPAVARDPGVVGAHPGRAGAGPRRGLARGRRVGRRPRGRSRRAVGAVVPAHRGEGGVVDSHAHLDSCDADPAELVAEAAAAGVERIVTIGVGRRSAERAVALCEAHPEVRAAVGVHPHDADAFTAADEAWIRDLAAPPRRGGHRRVRARLLPRPRPPDAQRRAFTAQIGLARESALPLVVHTRDAADETLGILAAEAGDHPVVMHCFSMPERLGEVAERGYLMSFAGQVTYPSAGDLQARRGRRAGRAPAGRDRQPLPVAGPAARPPQPAGQRGPHTAVRGGAARRVRGGPRRAHHPQRRPRLRLVTRGARPRRPRRGHAPAGRARPAPGHGPGPALPPRREPGRPRRARGRRRPRRRRLRDRRRPRRPDRRARPGGPRRRTRSRSTGAWSRRSPRSLLAHTT